MQHELTIANEAVKRCVDNSETGMIFQAGRINWDTAVMVTITDASFAQESYTDLQGNTKSA